MKTAKLSDILTEKTEIVKVTLGDVPLAYCQNIEFKKFPGKIVLDNFYVFCCNEEVSYENNHIKAIDVYGSNFDLYLFKLVPEVIGEQV